MEGKMFVLLSVPEVEDRENYLTDYLESVLDSRVNSFDFNPLVPDRVLVTMIKTIDLTKITRVVAGNSFDGQTMAVESPNFGNALVVTSGDLLHEHALALLKCYFEKKYAGGKEIISSYFHIPQSKISAFGFIDVEVMKRVLESQVHYVPFPKEKYKVVVEPFFHNFHGHIPIGNKTLNSLLEEESICSDTGIWNLQNQSVAVSDHVIRDSRQNEVITGPNCLGNPLNPKSMNMLEMDGRNAQPNAGFYNIRESVQAESQRWLQSVNVNDSIFPQNDEANIFFGEKDIFHYCISESEWKLIQSRIDCENVELEYNCDKALLIIRCKNIQDFVQNLKGLQSHILHEVVPIDKDTEILMGSHFGKEHLTSRFPDVQWYFREGMLHIYSFNNGVLREFRNEIKDLNINFENAALENKLSEEDQTLNQNYRDKICFVQISSDAKGTTITSLQKRAVLTVKKLCSPKENLGRRLRWSDIETIHRTSFEFSDFYYKFLNTHHRSEFSEALKCVASSTINRKCGKVFIELCGDRQDVRNALSIVNAIVHSIDRELKMCLKCFTHYDL